MEKSYRILDANANRVCEGLRVIEDWLRFGGGDAARVVRARELRHSIRLALREFEASFMRERDAAGDPGAAVSRGETGSRSAEEVLPANFKRVQEGLRVIEETLKSLQRTDLAKVIEGCRFASYTFEQETLTAMRKRRRLDALRGGLYGITAAEYSAGRSNHDVVKAMLEAGICAVQYREKERSLREKLRECDSIRSLTGEAGALFIVNDHADLALMAGADGVHLGQDDPPVERVRRLLPPEMIIGLSTHSPAQAEDAARQGADYIGVGPLFATRTKKNVCAPVGLEYLDYAVRNAASPFVAIGGIKEHNLREVLRRGARCVALVTEIVGAADIRAKIRTLQGIMREELERNGV